MGNRQKTLNWDKDWKRIKSYNSKNRTHEIQIHDIKSKFNIDCFIDCGPGSVGSEGWSVNDLINCDILGFEPQNERYDLLKEHGYPGILTKSGIGDVEGVVFGLMGYDGGKSDFWLNGDESLIGDEYKKEEIKITTIDKILEGKDYKKVFIWADIEGSELLMLKGAKKSLEKGIICGLNLELRNYVESKGHCTGYEVVDFLKNYGFENMMGNITIGHRDYLFKLKSSL